jgi:hypothetical protein
VPKSRVRRTVAYTPPPRRSPLKRRSAPWVGAVMLAMFVIGIVWLATYYISGSDVPGMRALGGWNLAIGMGFILAGFGLAVRWN